MWAKQRKPTVVRARQSAKGSSIVRVQRRRKHGLGTASKVRKEREQRKKEAQEEMKSQRWRI